MNCRNSDGNAAIQWNPGVCGSRIGHLPLGHLPEISAIRTAVHMMPASFEAIDRMDGQRLADAMASNADDPYWGLRAQVENLPGASRIGKTGSAIEAVSKRPSNAIAFRSISALPGP